MGNSHDFTMGSFELLPDGSSQSFDPEHLLTNVPKRNYSVLQNPIPGRILIR